MGLHCLKCWLLFLHWLNPTNALDRASPSPGFWLCSSERMSHLPLWRRHRLFLCLWGGQGLSPTYTLCVKSHPLCCAPLLLFHKSIQTDSIKAKHFFMEVTSLATTLCLSERNKTAPYKSREKTPLFLKFYLPEAGFSVHKTPHKSEVL